jgi:uncharacterized protein (TIGR03435 family)
MLSRQTKTYHGATMQDLADFLVIMSGRIPVRDRTGLTGHYDFRIQQTPPGTESRPILVIDHIEKPTAN